MRKINDGEVSFIKIKPERRPLGGQINGRNSRRRANVYHSRQRRLGEIHARPAPTRTSGPKISTESLDLFQEARHRDNASTQLTGQPRGIDHIQMRHELLRDTIENEQGRAA